MQKQQVAEMLLNARPDYVGTQSKDIASDTPQALSQAGEGTQAVLLFAMLLKYVVFS
jgi:hypothetical protein